MSRLVFANNRNLVLSGEINNESMGELILIIKSIEEEDNREEAVVKNYTREPICLNITSHGGSVYAALALIDVIESCKTPVHTYAYGNVMSSGVILFLAGHKRYCGHHALFMMHDYSMKMDDYLSVMNPKIGHLNKIKETLDDYIVLKTKITKKQLKGFDMEREVYLDANEALKLGIVHKIL